MCNPPKPELPKAPKAAKMPARERLPDYGTLRGIQGNTAGANYSAPREGLTALSAVRKRAPTAILGASTATTPKAPGGVVLG